MIDTKTTKLEIFIPDDFIAPLREAFAQEGIGVVGNYDSCLSTMTVKGYWRPLDAATPYDGQVGQVSEGMEIKVEVRCPIDKVPTALEIVRQVHPYEEPVVNIVPLLNHLFD